MKNKICIISIIVIVCILGIIIGVKLKSNNKEYKLEKVVNIEYMIFSENNKYGVINKNGDVIVSPIYDEVNIPNPLKPVFICMYNFNIEKQQYNVKVLNDKGEQILYEYYYVEPIKLEWSNSEIPFEKSVLKYKQNGKYGLIDFDGRIIAKAKYEEIISLKNQEGLLLVKKDGKFGVINIYGNYILKEKYDIITANSNYLASENIKNIGFVVGTLSTNGYKYGYVNYKGRELLKLQYEQIEVLKKLNEKHNYFVTFKDNKAGFYNNNKCIISNEYEDIIYNEYNNCLILQKDSKQGIADINGNVILKIEYDNIFISGKYVNTRKGSNIEIYNYTNNMQKINIENIIGLNETTNPEYSIAITIDEKYRIMNNNTNELKEQEYNYLEYLYDGYFMAYENEKFGIVDINGNVIANFKYNYLEKLPNAEVLRATIEEDNKIFYSYLDFTGKAIEYTDEQGLYPNKIGIYNKYDLGYNMPYYINKSNE